MKISRVEKRKQDTRQRIAHAALELFAKRGIDATTIAEISEAADIGKGTFFTYFPTKEDVFVEVGTLILERIGASLHAADLPADASAAHLLERAVLPGIDWHEAHPALSKVSVAVMMRQPSSLSARDPSISVLEGILVGIVEAGKAAGQFRADADARTAADVLLAVYFMGIVDWHQKGAKRGALKAQARAALDLVIKGIAA
ncbi:MAG: TetR/AcrR family transcriptional regulator [Deltaproteobacteria bacterium]|nr:TetR/AcrR family transcriptional regulator [Deltaproteobacteria bacterium]